jgi:hypothetical protein
MKSICPAAASILQTEAPSPRLVLNDGQMNRTVQSPCPSDVREDFQRGGWKPFRAMIVSMSIDKKTTPYGANLGLEQGLPPQSRLNNPAMRRIGDRSPSCPINAQADFGPKGTPAKTMPLAG